MAKKAAPKITKALPSKIKVGGIKKQPKWKLAFIGLTAVLLLTAVGFWGLSAYKVHSLKAKASSYMVVYWGNDALIGACKIYTPYGYSLRMYYVKSNSTSSSAQALTTVYSQGKMVSYKSSTTWWGNQITAFDTPAGSGTNTFTGSLRINNNYVIHSAGVTVSKVPDC